MKRMILASIASLFIGFAMAQAPQQPQQNDSLRAKRGMAYRGHGPQINPKGIAKEKTNRMVKKYNLNEKQGAELLALNEKYAGTAFQMRFNNAQGNKARPRNGKMGNRRMNKKGNQQCNCCCQCCSNCGKMAKGRQGGKKMRRPNMNGVKQGGNKQMRNRQANDSVARRSMNDSVSKRMRMSNRQPMKANPEQAKKMQEERKEAMNKYETELKKIMSKKQFKEYEEQKESKKNSKKDKDNKDNKDKKDNKKNK